MLRKVLEWNLLKKQRKWGAEMKRGKEEREQIKRKNTNNKGRAMEMKRKERKVEKDREKEGRKVYGEVERK